MLTVEPARPGLEGLMDRIGATALVIAGLVVFIPCGVLLIAGWQQAAPWQALCLIIPFAGWLVALSTRDLERRALMQSIAGLVVIASAIVLPVDGPPWLPLTTATFAVSFGAACALVPSSALTVIVSVNLLGLVGVIRAPAQVVPDVSELADGLLGPLFSLLICLGLLFVATKVRALAALADERNVRAEEAFAESVRVERVRATRDAVNRRIHETVLNTLASIGRGVTQDKAEMVREQCARDLERLQATVIVDDSRRLEALVEEARTASGLSERTSIAMEFRTDPTFPPVIASIVRDALVEALRNVERHAHATRVTIASRNVDGATEITVADDGRGLDARAQERFGLRRTLRDALASIGGSVHVGANPSGGTTVRLLVPVTIGPEPAVGSSFDVLLNDAASRLLLAGPAFFGLVLLPWLAPGFAPPAGLVAAYLAFVGGNVVLALTWRRVDRRLVAAAVVVTGVAVMSVCALTMQGCASVATYRWVLTCVGSGMALVIAVRSSMLRWGAIALVTAASIAATLALPSTCRGEVVPQLLSNAVYMVGVAIMASVLMAGFDRQRDHAMTAWREAARRDADRASREVALAAWRQVAPSTLQLLGQVARGEMNLDDPSVRARAAAQEASVRARLAVSTGDASTLAVVIVDAVEAAADIGRSVDSLVLSAAGSRAVVPEPARRFLTQLCTTSASDTVSLRLLNDGGAEELIASATAADVRECWRAIGWEPIESGRATVALPTTDGTMTVDVFIAAEQPAVVQLRREVG